MCHKGPLSKEQFFRIQLLVYNALSSLPKPSLSLRLKMRCKYWLYKWFGKVW